MAAPKNSKLNLVYKRLIDYCQKNKITITNLSTVHLSPTAILTGPCITNGCSNNFEKRYGDLLTTNGYCKACTSNTNIEDPLLNINNNKITRSRSQIKDNTQNNNQNKQIMTLQEIHQYIKGHINDKPELTLLSGKILDFSTLICGSLKTDTCTLQQTFLFPRTHTLYFCDLKNETTVSKLIVLFQDNMSVYRSALFQDILVPVYDYSPFAKGNFLEKYRDVSEKEKQDIINEVDVNLLIEHYKKIDWDQCIHLNNKNRICILNSYYRIQIEYTSKEIQVFNIKRENKNIFNNTLKIIALNTDTITKNFDKLKKEIYDDPRSDIILQKTNIGSEKWYSNKYKEFLATIDNSN